MKIKRNVDFYHMYWEKKKHTHIFVSLKDQQENCVGDGLTLPVSPVDGTVLVPSWYL